VVMGIKNVLAAFAMWAGKVPQTSFTLLSYMAATSMDTDAEPWFSRGHEHLAIHALGRPAEVERADVKAVERAISPLLRAGAIDTIRRASVRRDGLSTAAYRLNLGPRDVPRKAGDEDAQDSHRPPKTVPDVPHFPDSRPPENGRTPPESGGQRSL
jgi:hypothetical protein